MSHDNDPNNKIKKDSPTSCKPVLPEGNPCQQEEHSQKSNHKKTTKFLKAETMTMIFTGIIAIWTIIYSVFAGLQWWEIRGSSSDTHNLAIAARKQAEQAKAQTDKMKASLDKTDKLIRQATEQAQASDALAAQARRSANIAEKGVDSTIKSAREDRRPWVGLKDYQCQDCTSTPDRRSTTSTSVIPTLTETLSIGSLFGVMENTGKTPAVDMIVNAVWTDRKGRDPIPDYDSIQQETEKWEKEFTERRKLPPDAPPEFAARWAESEAEMAKTMKLTKRLTEATKTVLPPNAARILPIIEHIQAKRDGMATIEDEKIFYVVGKITYFGTERDKQYITKFCLMNDYGATFRFCPSGNDME